MFRFTFMQLMVAQVTLTLLVLANTVAESELHGMVGIPTGIADSESHSYGWPLKCLTIKTTTEYEFPNEELIDMTDKLEIGHAVLGVNSVIHSRTSQFQGVDWLAACLDVFAWLVILLATLSLTRGVQLMSRSGSTTESSHGESMAG